MPSNKLANDDRKNLAKSVSGFGNSEGGLIIWGVDCNAVSDVGDVPIWPPKKVPNVKMFKTLLDNAVGGLTLPSHQGVENIEIVYPQSDEGYVVTHVPVALNVPLQTLFSKGKQEFYIRAGSNFLPTPRAVLAGLFGRSPQADFKILVQKGTFQQYGTTGQVRLNFEVRCRNSGRGIARDMFFNIDVNLSNSTQINLSTYQDIQDSWVNSSDSNFYSSTLICKTSKFPPGAIKRFFEFSITLSKDPVRDITVSVSCGAANSSGVSKEFTIPWSPLGEVYLHYLTDYPDASAKQAVDKHYEPMILQYIR